MKKWLKNNWYIFLAIGLILIDQLSKMIAIKYLDHEVVIIDNFFSFVLTFNEGAAWSMLSDHPIILKLISVLACIAIALYYFLAKQTNTSKIGLAFLFAGAFANGIDRIFFGKVTDFINCNIFVIFNDYFPIFNIADLCVTAGVILVIISALFLEKEE